MKETVSCSHQAERIFSGSRDNLEGNPLDGATLPADFERERHKSKLEIYTNFPSRGA